ncbi:MAG: hypothetical protein ABL982_03620 [Vicinamibacterales bacterium]
MSRFKFAAMLAIALSAAACSNNDTVTSPTTAPPVSVTDTFNGTLNRNGAASFPFNVSAQGFVYATLTSVADTTVPMGLSLGIWNTTTSVCSMVLSNDAAVQGTTLTGSATNIGQLCVRVYDVGKLVDPLDYQLTVVHY